MITTDILIIGGGIAGCSAALHLGESGHAVTLLENGGIASEASGVNAGSIGGAGWGRMPDLEAYLTMGSLELFKQMQLDRGCDIEFRHSGTLQAIQSEAQHAYARDYVLSSHAGGHDLELLSSREVRALEPEWNPALPGAIYSPRRGQADPVKTTHAFADAAAKAGARLYLNSPANSIQSRPDGTYFVTTPSDTFHVGTLVLAAGPWCGPLGALLGLRIPILPVRGQMWATAVLPPRVFHTISSVESLAYWAAGPGGDAETPPNLTHHGDLRVTRHLYGRQTRAGDVIFGGDRQSVGYNKTPDPSGIEINHDQASQVLPFLRDLPIHRTWAGLMPFSLDGKAIIGKIPQYPNLYIVSGLASSGFGRGPMAGKLIADYVHTGHPAPVLTESDPARCVVPS